jgi:hypothetical protein
MGQTDVEKTNENLIQLVEYNAELIVTGVRPTTPTDPLLKSTEHSSEFRVGILNITWSHWNGLVPAESGGKMNEVRQWGGITGQGWAILASLESTICDVTSMHTTTSLGKRLR